MNNRTTWVAAHKVLSPETISAAEIMGLEACRILDRWILGWKKRTLELQKSGDLLPRLQQQVEQEREVAKATEPGGEYAWMGSMEYGQLMGIDPAP